MITVEYNDISKQIDTLINVPIPVIQCANIIKKDIEYNLHHSLNIQGGQVAGLKPSTIKQKKHSKVFFKTGELYRSVVSYMKSKNEAIVTIAGRRSEVANYLNKGTDRMPKREFYGVSDKAILKMKDLLSNIKINVR